MMPEEAEFLVEVQTTRVIHLERKHIETAVKFWLEQLGKIDPYASSSTTWVVDDEETFRGAIVRQATLTQE